MSEERKPRQVPVREWTCPEHDYPQRCGECETWHCADCEASEWVTTGYRDAEPFEAFLLDLGASPNYARLALLDKLERDPNSVVPISVAGQIALLAENDARRKSRPLPGHEGDEPS